MLGSSDFEDKTLDVTIVDQPKKTPQGCPASGRHQFPAKDQVFSQKNNGIAVITNVNLGYGIKFNDLYHLSDYHRMIIDNMSSLYDHDF